MTVTDMLHYWIPCSGCKKPQFQGLEAGNVVPTTATCRACAPDHSASVTFKRNDRAAAAPFAPCCKTGRHKGEVAEPPDA